LLFGAPQPAPRSAPSTPSPDAPPAWSSKSRTRALAAIAGAAGVLTFVAPKGADESAGGPIVRAKLEIVLVDDETDPLAHVPDEDLPEGASIYTENVPAGPGRQVASHYVRIVPGGGERIADAEARLKAWLDAVPLPYGERFAFQDVTEEDDEGRAAHVVGTRTLVLRGTPIVTEVDVDDASASIDKEGLDAPYVAIAFTRGGAERFRIATRDNVQRRIAIVLNGRVDSAPVVKTEIGGGHASITLGATNDPRAQIEDAKRLARSLRGR
jgi:preprotein translocase subunit SecD